MSLPLIRGSRISLYDLYPPRPVTRGFKGWLKLPSYYWQLLPLLFKLTFYTLHLEYMANTEETDGRWMKIGIEVLPGWRMFFERYSHSRIRFTFGDDGEGCEHTNTHEALWYLTVRGILPMMFKPAGRARTGVSYAHVRKRWVALA